ncbi:MAG: hypothetical protein ABIH39_06215 [Candidatus Margulisiibacteriota bacterium]
MKHLLTFIFTCIILALSSVLLADSIITITGEKVEGKILKETKTSIDIETGPGIVITLEKKNIEKVIKSDETAPEPTPNTDTAATEPAVKESIFQLKDGMKIAGVIELNSIKVDTEYGVLNIPVNDIIRIRIGKKCDKQLIEKIADLIEKLGSPDFKVREEAANGLKKLGPIAATELRNAAKSSDVVIKTTSEEILTSLIGREEEIVPDEDIIETVQFTAVGDVNIQIFEIKTKYGKITIKKQDLGEIIIPTRSDVSIVETVAAAMGFQETKISVSAGDKITIKATGTISYGVGGLTFSPDGGGRQLLPVSEDGYPCGTLLGRIGSNGQIFKIGSNYTDTVNSNGVLYLKIATFDPDDFIGEYKVEIQVKSK